MKIITSCLVLISFFGCANGETEPNNRIDTAIEESDANSGELPSTSPENTTQSGSQKELLLGDWQDANDPELSINYSPDMFTTYVNGKMNWNNPWDLCNYIDYSPENRDDNGKYVLVHLADKSAVFYAQEIISLTPDQLVVTIVKGSGGTGMTQTFIRN